jgi:hypothetical protein
LVEQFIEALRWQAKHFGPELARTAYRRGLAVTAKDGSTKPIPITATPIICDGEEIQRRAQLSARLSSAGFKMARAVLEGEARELLFGAMSPVEKAVLERTEGEVERIATTRVDYFVLAGKPRALELNTTIPAMQGYSDLAANSFIEAVGREAQMKDHHIAGLQAKNGSNAMALYRALLQCFAAERDGAAPKRMAILCRPNDAQITELRYLAERFSEWGTEADVVHPDQLSGDDSVQAGGKTYDLVYRHLFVRRLEETPSPYVQDLVSTIPGKKAVVVNPPSAQVEVKTTFALLSMALENRALREDARLSDNELQAIKEAVPWTRPFRFAPGLDEDRTRIQELMERVSAEPAKYVLKRAWDYGGKAVFLGKAVGTPLFDERVKAAYGEALSWADLCKRAADDPVGGGFVVQEVVDAEPEPHVLCSESGIDKTSLYVDFSAYGSVGLDPLPRWGGVCRGSISAIVNIMGGGGVIPLLTREVAQSLATAFKARQLM